MKKNLVSSSLEELKNAAHQEAPAARNEDVVLTASDVQQYKNFFGAKWDGYARRGNPYGEVKGIRGGYRRATYIVYEKQLKALNEFAASEGLTLKQALEISIEIGLKALTGKDSDSAEVTEEDRAKKFERKK